MVAKTFSVYKITGYGLVYYGSTTKTLNRRKTQHKSDYEKYKSGNHGYVSSYDILSQGDDWDIELVEIVQDKDQLFVREKYYIKNYECVNKNVPGRTDQEKKEIKKEYDAQWFEANKEKMKEYFAQRYQENKDHIKEQHAQYREANKEKLNAKARERARERVKCPHCCMEMNRNSLRRHIKRKHKE